MQPFVVVLTVKGRHGAAVNDLLIRQLMSETDNVEIEGWSIYNKDLEEASNSEEEEIIAWS